MRTMTIDENQVVHSAEAVIVIPTLGRVQQQRTLANLPAEWQARAVLCVPASEADQHTYPRLMVHADLDGIGKTRQFIHEHVDAPVVVHVDDDLDFYERYQYEPPRIHTARPEAVGRCFDELTASLLADSTIGLATVSQRQGNCWVTDRWTDKPGRPCRVLGYRPETLNAIGFRFRTRTLEDFDLGLTVLRSGLRIGTSYHFAQGQRASNAAGGCSLTRTRETHDADVRHLAHLHPGFVTVVQRTSKTGWFEGGARTEAQIAWAKAAAAGRRPKPTHPGTALMRVSDACRILAAANTIDEIKLLRDQASTFQEFVRAQKLGLDKQNDAAEIKLRAERKLGELLADTKARGRCLRDEGTGKILGAARTLPDGITDTQSHRWQRCALVPEENFIVWVERIRAAGEELTSKGLYDLARPHAQNNLVTDLPLAPGGRADEDAQGPNASIIEGQLVDDSGAPLPDAYAQMVQLFLTVKTKRVLQQQCDALMSILGTDNLSDTVLLAVDRVYAELVAKRHAA